MRKILGILLVAALLVGRGAAQGDDAARELIVKAVKAAGGEAALAKHRATTYKEVGTYHGMGEGQPYTGLYISQLPEQFRMEIEGAFVSVFNRDKGWTKMGDAVKEMTKEELAAQRNDHRAGYVATLLPLLGKDFTLTSLAEEKIDGRAVLGVKVTAKDYPDVKLYLDKETLLLTRSVFPTKASEDKFKDATMEVNFGKYQEIDGAKVATKLVMKRDGKVYVEADVRDVKAVGKLDDALFGKP